MARECPITRDHFREHATPITLTLPDGKTIELDTKEFKSDSFGWYTNTKFQVDVGGTKVWCQAGFNLTVIGSKRLDD